jgi:hypothetical protein
VCLLLLLLLLLYTGAKSLNVLTYYSCTAVTPPTRCFSATPAFLVCCCQIGSELFADVVGQLWGPSAKQEWLQLQQLCRWAVGSRCHIASASPPYNILHNAVAYHMYQHQRGADGVDGMA